MKLVVVAHLIGLVACLIATFDSVYRYGGPVHMAGWPLAIALLTAFAAFVHAMLLLGITLECVVREAMQKKS